VRLTVDVRGSVDVVLEEGTASVAGEGKHWGQQRTCSRPCISRGARVIALFNQARALWWMPERIASRIV
jgi:hypothetical protein